MKRNWFLSFVFALLSLAAFLVFLTRGIPGSYDDLIMNEIGNQQYEIEQSLEIIRKRSSGGTAFNERAREAIAQMVDVVVCADSLNGIFQRILNKSSVTREKGLAQIASEIRKVRFKSSDSIILRASAKALGYRIRSTNPNIQTLSLVQLQNSIQEDLLTICDSLSQIAEAMTMKFDRINGVKPTPEASWTLGQIGFHVPVVMTLDQRQRIRIRISKKFEKEMISSLATEGVTVDSIQVGDIMSVKLQGETFDIVSHDEEEQGISNDGYTQWEFDITPRSSGNNELFLKVGILYYVPNLGPTKKYFPVYEKVIQVEVSVWQMVANFTEARWEFLVSTFIIPFLVWGVSRWRTKQAINK